MGETTCEHEYHWYPAINEEGWRCCLCQHRPGEPPGFAPALDRELLGRKVEGLLLDMHESKLLYVSNGSMGESLSALVARRCREAGLFDQYTIALYLVEALQGSHAEYWKRISDGVIASVDPRVRCHCGALATSYSNGKGTCREHWEMW